MHPFGDLSAYLDGALASEARASVQAHLDTCALCRTRLAELRATARLIAALPMPVPSRSLIPRVSVPAWLAPLRTFSTFASGAAIFVFLALAVISYFPRASSAQTAGAPAAGAPAPNTLSAPQASGERGGGAPSSGFNAPSPSPAAAVTADDRTAARASAAPGDALKEVGRQQDSAGPSSNAVADQSTRLTAGTQDTRFAFLLSPWPWLMLAIAFGALSFLVGRRLRSA